MFNMFKSEGYTFQCVDVPGHECSSVLRLMVCQCLVSISIKIQLRGLITHISSQLEHQLRWYYKSAHLHPHKHQTAGPIHAGTRLAQGIRSGKESRSMLRSHLLDGSEPSSHSPSSHNGSPDLRGPDRRELGHWNG